MCCSSSTSAGCKRARLRAASTKGVSMPSTRIPRQTAPARAQSRRAFARLEFDGLLQRLSVKAAIPAFSDVYTSRHLRDQLSDFRAPATGISASNGFARQTGQLLLSRLVRSRRPAVSKAYLALRPAAWAGHVRAPVRRQFRSTSSGLFMMSASPQRMWGPTMRWTFVAVNLRSGLLGVPPSPASRDRGATRRRCGGLRA